MKKFWIFHCAIAIVLLLSACETSTPIPIPTPTPLPVDAAHPCIGSPVPAQWHHIVVLIFENKRYDQVIGPAPYITSLANKCATAANWQDANTKVDGSPDGKYPSKPNYATRSEERRVGKEC